MTPPLFSIVIPTRERPETLDACLGALSAIDYDTIEFVVHDNAGSPQTGRIIARHAERDERFVTVRSDTPLSQRQSFEAGLRQARGLYLGIIGDDDALIGSALPVIERLILQEQPDTVAWPLAHYFWPGITVDGRGFLDLPDSAFYGRRSIRSGEAVRTDLLAGRQGRTVPRAGLYHGLISRRVYNRALSVHGEIFGYPLAGLYGQCLAPFYADAMALLPSPASLRGHGARSTSIAWPADAPDRESMARTRTAWLDETAIDACQPAGWTPLITSLRYHRLQALKQVLDGHRERAPELDVEAFIAAMAAEVEADPARLAGYRTAWDEGAGDRTVIERLVAGFADIAPPRIVRRAFAPASPARHLPLAAMQPPVEDGLAGALTTVETLAGDSHEPLSPALVAVQRLRLKSRLRRLNRRHAGAHAARPASQTVRVDYAADGIGLSGRLAPFGDDARFDAAWTHAAEHNDPLWPSGTPDRRWRAHVACWAAGQALHSRGDFAECGVRTGLISLPLCGALSIDRTDRRLYLFDRFDGAPDRSDPAAPEPTFSLDQARRAYARHDHATLVPGTLPDTLDQLPPDARLALLAIDLGDATAEMEVMARLWQRLSPGAVVLIDDFARQAHREQHDAWSQFAGQKGLPILALPTGQGLLVRAS